MSKTLLFGPDTFNFAEVTRCMDVAAGFLGSGVSSRIFAAFLVPIEKAGFEYRALIPEMTDSEIGMAMDLDQGRGLRHPFMVPMVRRRVISERSLIQKQKADAVVIGTTLGQLISARAEKASLFCVKPFAYLMPHMAQMRRTGFLPTEKRRCNGSSTRAPPGFSGTLW